MSNYRRAYVNGGTYFFTLTTWQRRPILIEYIDALRAAFRKEKKKRPFDINAIVILPDHLHCIMSLPVGDINYSTRWKCIKQHFSKQIETLVNHRQEKQVWQRRFWEHVIRDEHDLNNHLAYIFYNPVKHGYVEKPLDWQYSSFTHSATTDYPNTSIIPDVIQEMTQQMKME
ncbi:MAG: transposase [Thiotrichaceae bacterium]|nr:transposase [Thiotrichaceae bacterium]